MDRSHVMMVFDAIAQERSFAGGARRLSMVPPAVTRAIAVLEAGLSVKLLNRPMCYARVTDARQHYLDDARRIIAEADEADVVYREGRYAKAKLRRLVDVMVARLCAGAALNDSEDRKGRSSAAHARACRYAFVSVI